MESSSRPPSPPAEDVRLDAALLAVATLVGVGAAVLLDTGQDFDVEGWDELLVWMPLTFVVAAFFGSLISARPSRIPWALVAPAVLAFGRYADRGDGDGLWAVGFMPLISWGFVLLLPAWLAHRRQRRRRRVRDTSGLDVRRRVTTGATAQQAALDPRRQ